MSRRWLWSPLWLVLMLLVVVFVGMAPLSAQAQTRAWLDRDHIALGEAATLNIETDQANIDAPDFAPLSAEFRVSATSSSRQMDVVQGKITARVLFAVALEPRREGVLTIPALRVGARTTQPLTLTVTSSAAAPSARAGDPAFIESEVDVEQPYVQQAVGYVVRLYHTSPLISGSLDQDPPDGATLQRVGSDVEYSRNLGGRQYRVVERRFLLIPERSGSLTIPGGRFHGRGVGGFFDDLFGDGERNLRANGAPRFLRVLPAPANAPQPWLPLRGLSLRYLAAPQAARAGEAVSVVIEASADGANATQMPELQLAASDGAQVFAEPAQTDETFTNGRPQVKVTRKFSIVPAQAGALRVQGPRMAWWDVRAGIARNASLPDLNLQVAAAVGGSLAGVAEGAGDGAPAAGDALSRMRGLQGGVRPWALATIVFALLWLGTLLWALQRRQAAASAPAPLSTTSSKGLPAVPARAHKLKQALDNGDLGDVADALCAMATPPAQDLDDVQTRLDDPAQLAAVAQLQRARWADGDGSVARAALRAAFKHGPRWRQTGTAEKPLLPPLYPD